MQPSQAHRSLPEVCQASFHDTIAIWPFVSEPTPPPPVPNPYESPETKPTSAPVSSVLVAQLAAMMFLMFLPPGMWTVTVGTYIGENTGGAGTGMFDAWFVGLAGMAAAIGAIGSPLLFGALADSWFRSERMIAALNLACAAVLVLTWNALGQWWFLAGMVAYYQFSVPGLTLAHSLALRHLAGAKHVFPVVRASGTAGWIAALWIVGTIMPWAWNVPSKSIEETTWPMVFAAIGHVVMAVFALTLPRTLPLGKAVSWRTLLHASVALIASQPRLVRFLLVSFCATIAAQFYNMYVNLYLNNIGVPHAATRLSYGQVVEIGCMLLLPWLLVRWGPKRVFVIGVAAWMVRYLCLAYGGHEGLPLVLIYVAILLHGACYTFVYITGFIYVDHSATPETQSAAQGLLAMVTSGLGHLAGSLLSGAMQARFLTPEGVEPPPYEWRWFFLVAATVAAVAIVLFWVLMGIKREVMPGEIEPDEAV